MPWVLPTLPLRISDLHPAGASGARSGSGRRATARPWRTGEGARDFAGRTERLLGKFRFHRDPLVADDECRRAGASFPCRCGQCGRAAARWACGDRRAPTAALPSGARARPIPRPCWKVIQRRSRHLRSRLTALFWRRHPGIRPCDCGRWQAVRRACWKAIRKTSTASHSPRTAARWSASATIRACGYGRWRIRRRRPSCRCRPRSTPLPSAAMVKSPQAAPTAAVFPGQ